LHMICLVIIFTTELVQARGSTPERRSDCARNDPSTAVYADRFMR
jgi:hypothetical protein